MKQRRIVDSVQIEIELLMYGYVGFCISGDENSVFASWVAVDDGGGVVSNDAKEIRGKDFITLTNALYILDLPEEESEEMSRCWNIIFRDENDNIVKDIKRGYWDINILNNIVSIIESFTADTEITEWLHNIIEA